MIGKYGPEKCDLKNTVQKNTIQKMRFEKYGLENAIKKYGQNTGTKTGCRQRRSSLPAAGLPQKYYNSAGNDAGKNAGKRPLLLYQLFEFLHAGGVVGGGIFVVFQFCPVDKALHQLEIL